MSIRNILVALELLTPKTPALACAVSLADRLGASVSGFAAARPWGDLASSGLSPAAADLLDRQRAQIEEAALLAEERFHSEVPQALQARFSSYVEAPTERLIEAAASTDLIVLPPSPRATPSDERLHTDAGQVMVAAGRPVLMLGESAKTLPLRHVLIAWKDTREARRAVADALPLLQLAEHIDVIAVDEGEYARERVELDSMAEWLAAHEVSASHDVLPLTDSVGKVLASLASTKKCDLVVSGGYGHARLREWLFGGVTRDLLEQSQLTRFMSN